MTLTRPIGPPCAGRLGATGPPPGPARTDRGIWVPSVGGVGGVGRVCDPMAPEPRAAGAGAGSR